MPGGGDGIRPIELASHHRTWLSGRDTGQEPTRAGSLPDRLFTPIMWLMATRLTVKTRFGRKLRDHFLDPPRGIPLGRVRRKDFAPAGVERVPRMTGVMNRCPVLEDGRVLEVSNVIWCTGFTPDFGWIDVSLPIRNGVPIHDRGIVESCSGLYFVGFPSSTRSARRYWAVWDGMPSTSSTTSFPPVPQEYRIRGTDPVSLR
jgi:putative flavoprotein involved in K+ transport